jgi:hypothetical protein
MVGWQPVGCRSCIPRVCAQDQVCVRAEGCRQHAQLGNGWTTGHPCVGGVAKLLPAVGRACRGPEANWEAKCRGCGPLAVPNISSLETILLWPTTSRIQQVWCCSTCDSRHWLREECPKTASTRTGRIHPRNLCRKWTMVGGTRCGSTMDGRRNQLQPESS